MLLHTECFNPYHTNCYFLTDEESGSTVIIDPGCYFRRERTRVQHLIRFLTKAYGCPFGASPLDNDWIDRAPDRCREVGLEVRMPFVSPTFSLAHGDTVRFGSESLSVLSVPGHSPGSLVFYSSSAHCLFSGDTLFRGGIGRTDLPGGNRRLLTESIRHQLLRFPDDTAVYCSIS